jgi:hypothetical protein
MKVEIGAEAAQFPEKENINGIAFAVHTYKDDFAFYSDTHSPSMDVTSDHTLRSLCTSLDVWHSSLLALLLPHSIPMQPFR